MDIFLQNEYVKRFKTYIGEKDSRRTLGAITACNVVRLIYLAEGLFSMIYVTQITQNYFYLFLIMLLVYIVMDNFFVSFTRQGYEYKWFSMSTCFYCCTLLTAIWCLVFFKYEGNDGKCNKNSESNRESAFWKAEFGNVCSIMELLVSLLIYTVVFCRFFLPLENIGRKEIFSVLQDYLINGADSVEFYSYMDEPRISQNFSAVYGILCLFTLSTLQYMFGLAARRKRYPHSKGLERILDILFGTEIWPLLLVCFTMDFPFFIMRFYILVTFETTSKNYTLYFFLIKNMLLVVFELYKVAIILIEELSDEDVEDEDANSQKAA